jgi:phospholipid/cholesterol/gamma-HCH transport system substrate-binding protein
MKDQRKTEIKVGLTVFLGIILLIWILGWAKNMNVGSQNREVMVKFPNTGGLEVGDNVTVNGVREGTVDDISIKNNFVLVKLSLNRNVNLKKDASFNLDMVDMMGGKKIDIFPGNSTEPIDYHQIQNGNFTADIPAVMSMLGPVQNDLVTTLKQVKIAVTSMNKYLTDDQLNSEIKSSVKNLNDITLKVNQMITENSNNIKQLTANSVDLTNQAKSFINDNKKDISHSVKEISAVLSSTDSLLTKLNDFADEIKEKKNNVGKIMYDEDLLHNLNSSIKQVNELTQILLKQLKEKGLKVDAKINIF